MCFNYIIKKMKHTFIIHSIVRWLLEGQMGGTVTPTIEALQSEPQSRTPPDFDKLSIVENMIERITSLRFNTAENVQNVTNLHESIKYIIKLYDTLISEAFIEHEYDIEILAELKGKASDIRKIKHKVVTKHLQKLKKVEQFLKSMQTLDTLIKAIDENSLRSLLKHVKMVYVGLRKQEQEIQKEQKTIMGNLKLARELSKKKILEDEKNGLLQLEYLIDIIESPYEEIKSYDEYKESTKKTWLSSLLEYISDVAINTVGTPYDRNDAKGTSAGEHPLYLEKLSEHGKVGRLSTLYYEFEKIFREEVQLKEGEFKALQKIDPEKLSEITNQKTKVKRTSALSAAAQARKAEEKASEFTDEVKTSEKRTGTTFKDSASERGRHARV